MIFISGLKLIYIRFLSTGNIGTKKEEHSEISRSIHFDPISLILSNCSSENYRSIR